MQNSSANDREATDTTVSPPKGLMIMAGSVLAIVAAVAIPVLGEVSLAALLYGKSVKKAFEK